MVKPQKKTHRCRARTAPVSQVIPVTRRRGARKVHPIGETTAEETNACLAAYVRRRGRVRFLYLDPPWSYGKLRASRTCLVSPEHHYPTMTTADLLAFDFGQAAEKDAMCAMWTPVSQVPLAIQMLEGQGFRYVTQIAWHKLLSKGGSAGCPTKGAVRPMHEVLILARRGRGLPVAKGVGRIASVVQALREGHSVKPALFRTELARVYPTDRGGCRTTFLELFARQRAAGWRAWGNQAPRTVGGATRVLAVA